MGIAQAGDALESQILNHQFRSATWAKPTANWIALFTVAPSDSGGGTEVVGGGYARVNLPPADANWTAVASTGITSNAVPVTFPTPTADWGAGAPVTHIGIFDAPTGGTLVIWDALTEPRTIRAGDPAPAFPVGALQIRVN